MLIQPQARVNTGLWMPTRMQIIITVKLLSIKCNFYMNHQNGTSCINEENFIELINTKVDELLSLSINTKVGASFYFLPN